jgi:cytochrome c oxidase assembly protein subunit 15
VWGTRSLLLLGAVTIFFGTAATAAGPHAGGAGTGDEIDRLEWKGIETLDWAIHQHGRLASVLGVAAVAVFVLLRLRGAERDLQRAVGAACVMLGIQGVVGGVQYALELPAEIVWLHASLAAVTWLAIVWAVVAAGQLQARALPAAGASGEAAPAR